MGRTGIGLVWLCFCCVISASLSQFVNVAMGKTYNQSSTYDTSHPPSYAANGNTSGTYANTNNCIHTGFRDNTPWWLVDLGRTYPVYNITVWARAGQIERLYPLSITVDGQQCVNATSTGYRKQNLNCASPINGRVVHLTRGYKTGELRFLNLCEVEIWVCEDRYYLNDKKCVPCSNNCVNSQCDSTSGICNGCRPGYHGNQCNSDCSTIESRCSGCTQGGQCTACSGNFQPPQCTACQTQYYKSGQTCVQCSSNCVSRQCDSDSGRCDSCVNYRWGNKCGNSCSSNCATYPCNRDTGKCNGCKSGHHGNQCNSDCSTIESRCSGCTQAGQCTACSGNFQPPRCTACQDGYYLSGNTCQLCSSNCNNLGCESGNGRCYGCVSNTWGNKCENSCSSNCATYTCSRDTGKCNGCKTGYHGDQCNSHCNSITPQCSWCTQDGQCRGCSGNFQPPQCTACKDGYFLSSNTCQQCSWNCNNRRCDPDNGRCYGCRYSYRWGNQCDKSCSSQCATYPCDQGTGKCDRCTRGYYGDHCNISCSMITPQCSECTQEGQCSACRSTYFQQPQCTDCVANHWGDQCLNTCSSQCANTTCGRDTGKCNGCKASGVFGDQCKVPCSNVARGCSQCTQDGSCTACHSVFRFPGCTDCINKTYGDNCEHSCGHCKGEQACDSLTGVCTTGCGLGFKSSDTLCMTECDGGTHGENCSLECGHCQGNVTCHHATGECSAAGCVPGFSGAQCLYAKLADSLAPYFERMHKGLAEINRRVSVMDNRVGRCEEMLRDIHGQAAAPVHPAQQAQPARPPPPALPQQQYPVEEKEDLVRLNSELAERDVRDRAVLFLSAIGGPTLKDSVNNILKWLLAPRLAFSYTLTGKVKTKGRLRDLSHLLDTVYAIPPEDPFPSAAIGAGIGVAVLLIIIVVILVVVFRRRRQHANKSKGIAREAANQSSSMEELNDSNTPLSFATVAVDGDAHPRPKEAMKPKPKPAVKPRPRQTAKSSDVIYENVLAPGILSAEPSESADKGNASAPKTSAQPSSGRAISSANGKKHGKPPVAAKPAKGKAVHTSGENLPEPEDYEAEEPVYGNDPKFFKTPKSLILSELQKSVADKLRGDTLEKEFEYMEPVKDFPMVIGARQENYYKIRFKTILPYDNNRVQLDQVDGDDASDFFNASFIKGFKLEKGYIASQGPKTNIHDDFWRMVWQEKVTDIVMLTNLKEGIKDKCSEYWPAERATMKTRHMEVTGVGDVETRAHFFIRTFDIKHKESKDKRRVKQYHYISWMDHEVPAITPLINFWRYVRTHAPRLPSAPPLLVHCSAGVGRTGTFIALDIAIDEAEQSSEVNLFNIVDRLRDDRCFMVQNKSQYAFLHEAVLEAYTSHDTRIEVAAMDTVLPAFFNHSTPNAKIDAEYEMLNKMRNCPTAPTYTMANMPENTAKNRNPKVLPNDKHLVYITQHVKGRNQYISGVSMPTFLQQRGSIMTQLPLPDTVIDLWRLVDGADVKLIVSLGDVEGRKDMSCYWPKEDRRPLKTGPYVIKMTSSTKTGSALWSYTLTLEKDGSAKEVRVLHYTSWTGECADDTAELIHLLTTMQEVEKDSGDNPVIIQCIDGSLKSGILCALWDVVSRMTHDEELDIYLAARMVTMARPEAFVSVEQYRYCYEVAQQIKNSYNVYSNM